MANKIKYMCCSAIEAGKKQPAGVFYFTHHEMILLVLTSLGLAKDQQPLTHTTYDQMRNRQWRSSVISPFTSNLAAVFFK
jgi:multiple inositol-polyphosphate phosphatase/2,3-bisphosphoglycerate 3-phosphatase